MDFLPQSPGDRDPEPAHGLKFTQALDQMHEELGAVLARLTPDMAETLIQELETAPGFSAAPPAVGIYPPGFLMRLMHLGFTVYFVGRPPPPGSARRPAHGHVRVRGDGPAPGDATPGQHRGRPHPGPDHPPESTIGQEAR